MPTYLVRLKEDEFVGYSTVVEAPVTQVMTLAQVSAHEELGDPERIDRANRFGASVIPEVLRPDGTDPKSIDEWLEGESLNQRQPWTAQRIRDEFGYGVEWV